MADHQFTSDVELARAKSWQAVVTARFDIMSSVTAALIERPVPWNHRIKDYHNRHFVDMEWRNFLRHRVCIWFIHEFMYGYAQPSSCDYVVQCDSFGTRPKKMRISQRLFIRFWTCVYDYIPCFMTSMSILVSWSSAPFGKDRCVVGNMQASHNRSSFLPRHFVYCSLSENLQRICGSTWWWRAPKRLFSAGWSHMSHLEWEHDRNRKLFWWPDYFESLMTAKISWLKSARFFSCGAP